MAPDPGAQNVATRRGRRSMIAANLAEQAGDAARAAQLRRLGTRQLAVGQAANEGRTTLRNRGAGSTRTIRTTVGDRVGQPMAFERQLEGTVGRSSRGRTVRQMVGANNLQTLQAQNEAAVARGGRRPRRQG